MSVRLALSRRWATGIIATTIGATITPPISITTIIGAITTTTTAIIITGITTITTAVIGSAGPACSAAVGLHSFDSRFHGPPVGSAVGLFGLDAGVGLCHRLR